MIEKGVIKLSIMCRASFTHNSSGIQKNKTINFKIAKKDIGKLFDKILEYDADSQKNIMNSDYYFKN